MTVKKSDRTTPTIRPNRSVCEEKKKTLEIIDGYVVNFIINIAPKRKYISISLTLLN